MSDAVDYFRSYAVRAICKARLMPFGRLKRMQRAVGHIYHLLTKEASFSPNTHRLHDFRVAQNLEELIDQTQQPVAKGASASDRLCADTADAVARLH